MARQFEMSFIAVAPMQKTPPEAGLVSSSSFGSVRLAGQLACQLQLQLTLLQPIGGDLVPEVHAKPGQRQDNAVGPILLAKRSGGLPYTASGWNQAWKRMRKIAKVPEEIMMMDIRAGAVTEAKSLGVSEHELRDAAQHLQAQTTNRYSRLRSESANKVARLRNSG
ncbi:site-specific integrase [Pseudophaeobacter flagellatus]|uniref:hypothetical protein n=1 Tax=Pseudophaeobacter flagellatus TaxID=2899119 RepID=UPI001E4EEA9A|nr:hypothetical protein [Pseudophaeobacter flagellatus]MCD9148657.1 hypothetical protein [Pseudophaeobacter flagellatus]